jgi:hypothetical protein
VVATLGYDGLGRRQAKITSSTTQYLYDGLNPVQELSGANPPAVLGTSLNGLRLDSHFTRKDSSGNVSSFLPDALGSTLGLIGSAGTNRRPDVDCAATKSQPAKRIVGELKVCQQRVTKTRLSRNEIHIINHTFRVNCGGLCSSESCSGRGQPSH